MLTRPVFETPFDVLKIGLAFWAILWIGGFVGQSLNFLPYAGPIFVFTALAALAIENVVGNSRPEDTKRESGWVWLAVTFRDPWEVKQPLLVVIFGLCAGLTAVMFYAALAAHP